MAVLALVSSLILSEPNAHAGIYPSAHAVWNHVSLTPNQGMDVRIIPLVDDPQTTWTVFSNPCGPNDLNSSMCFEMGILSGHTAWFRVENTKTFYNYSSDTGIHCSSRSPNIFQDQNSYGMDCNKSMQDFAVGTAYDFSITPLYHGAPGSGQWWIVHYTNEKTGSTYEVGQFEFDYSPAMLSSMSNFQLTDQMNFGTNSNFNDCSQIPAISGSFSKPGSVSPQTTAFGPAGSNTTNGESYGNTYSTCTNFNSTSSTYAGMPAIKMGFGPASGNLPASTSSSTASSGLNGKLVRPSSGGSPISQSCPSGTTGAGIRVSSSDASDYPFVQDLRLLCLATAMPNSSAGISFPTVVFVSQPPGSNSINDAFCPPNTSMIGVGVVSNRYIRDVAPICANPLTGAMVSSPLQGAGPHETINDNSICPVIAGKQTFLTGLAGYGAAGVDGLQALCAGSVNNLASQSPSIPAADSNELLFKYVPSGTMATSDSLDPQNVGQGLTPSQLTEVSGDGTHNLNVLPFQTSSNFDANHFFQFSITPDLGKSISLNKITYSSRSYPLGSGSGNFNEIKGLSATTIVLRSSIDNFSSDLVSLPISPGFGTQQLSINAADLSSLPALTKTTAFRIYFYGSTGYQYNDLSGDPGTGGNGLNIYGSIGVAQAVAPESPKNISFAVAGGVIHITVDVPTALSAGASALKVYLLAPSLGYTLDNRLNGVISGSRASFALPITDALSGKSIPIQIFSSTNAGDSTPLQQTIDVPKVSVSSGQGAGVTPKASGSQSSGQKTAPKNQIQVPATPTNPTYKLNGNQVLITVDAPSKANAIATGAVLLAPDLGFTQGHPVAGVISNGKATFRVQLNSSMAGKSAGVSIFLTNSAGASKPLGGQVTLPPVIPDGNPAATSTNSSTVKCTKGPTVRTFQGANCPPGWARA